MGYKNITITPGTILVWKEHNKLKQWWYKLRKKELSWNRFNIVEKKSEWILLNSTKASEIRLFVPKKAYDKSESLECLIRKIQRNYTCDPYYICLLCNIIRPNTFEFKLKYDITDLENSKYYTEVDAA